MEQHIHPMYDDDVAHFHIDTDSRAISHTTAEKLVLIQGDHNSEIYTFDIPRFNDGHDMMLCNLVQIHFINIDANNSQNVSSGIYEVLDMQLDPLDPNTCICSWVISNEATPFVGRLTFALRFACMEGSRCTYVWNTQIFDGVPVQKSYNNSDLIMSEYTDILEKWYWEFVNTTTAGVNVIADAKDKAIAEIETVLFNRGGISVSEEQPTDSRIAIWIKPSDPLGTIRIHNLDTDAFDSVTLDTIKGEKGDKGDQGEPGDPTTFIVQEFGEREDVVISQAVMTKKMLSDSLSFEDISNRLNNVDSGIADAENYIIELQRDMESVEPLVYGIKNCLQYDESSGNSNIVYDVELVKGKLRFDTSTQEFTRIDTMESDIVTTLENLASTDGNVTYAMGEIESINNHILALDNGLETDPHTGELCKIKDIESNIDNLKNNLGYNDETNTSIIDDHGEALNAVWTDIGNLSQVIEINMSGEKPKSTRLDDMESDIGNLSQVLDLNTKDGKPISPRLDDMESDIAIMQSVSGFSTEKYDELAELVNTNIPKLDEIKNDLYGNDIPDPLNPGETIHIDGYNDRMNKIEKDLEDHISDYQYWVGETATNANDINTLKSTDNQHTTQISAHTTIISKILARLDALDGLGTEI